MTVRRHPYAVITATLVLIYCTSVLSGCTSPMHYRSYLYERHNYVANEYVMRDTNAIPIPKGQHVTLTLDAIHLGFIHREMDRHHSWGYDRGRGFFYDEYQPEDGLGGRELWTVAEITPLDQADTLRLKGERLVYASRIMQDQESFTFLPLNDDERIMLDAIVHKGYHVDIHVYSVHGVALKRQLLITARSGLGDLAWTAVKGVVQSSWGFLTDGLFSAIESKAKEPLFFEQLLLKASAELEFNGSVDLVLSDTATRPSPAPYILYDLVKSELDRDRDGKIDRDVKEAISAYARNLACAEYPSEPAKCLMIPSSYDSASRSVIPEYSPLIDLPKTMSDYVQAYLYLHGRNQPTLFPDPSRPRVLSEEDRRSPTEFLKRHNRSFVQFSIATQSLGLIE